MSNWTDSPWQEGDAPEGTSWGRLPDGQGAGQALGVPRQFHGARVGEVLPLPGDRGLDQAREENALVAEHGQSEADEEDYRGSPVPAADEPAVVAPAQDQPADQAAGPILAGSLAWLELGGQDRGPRDRRRNLSPAGLTGPHRGIRVRVTPSL